MTGYLGAAMMSGMSAQTPASQPTEPQAQSSEPQAPMPAGAALLQATIRDLAPSFPRAANLGATDDRNDLYWLIDYLCFAVDQAYPRIPCAGGCSDCCTNQVFRVSAAEWAVAKRGLAQLPEATRRAVHAFAEEVYGPHRGTLEALAAAWTVGDRPDPALHAAAPKACPMLVDGRCGIYHERPAICRAFGYFSATVGEKASVLMCHQRGPDWIRALEEAGVENLPMPSWNPIQRKLEALNGGQPIKPLPLWLLDDPT